MKLRKQIAVIVLALTATTSPVWSQDRQASLSPAAHTLQVTWRVTRTAVDCITGQDLVSFPAIMAFNHGCTCTGYAVPPGGDPGQGTEYGVWRREPGSQNYSYRYLALSTDENGALAITGTITATLHLTDANSFTSSATIQIFDADGNLIATFCGRQTATRFE